MAAVVLISLVFIWASYVLGDIHGYAKGREAGYEAGRTFADMEAKGETFRFTCEYIGDETND